MSEHICVILTKISSIFIKGPLNKTWAMSIGKSDKRIQNAILVTIAVSVSIGENRSISEIAFHIAAKMQFGQLKNLSNVAVLSRFGHILNPRARHYSRTSYSMHLIVKGPHTSQKLSMMTYQPKQLL